MDLSESQILTERQDFLHCSLFLSLCCLKVLPLQCYWIGYYGNHSPSADTASQPRTSLSHKTPQQWHKLQELQRYLRYLIALLGQGLGFVFFNNQLLSTVTSKPQQSKKCSQNSGSRRQAMSIEWHSELMPERDLVKSQTVLKYNSSTSLTGCIASEYTRWAKQVSPKINHCEHN